MDFMYGYCIIWVYFFLFSSYSNRLSAFRAPSSLLRSKFRLLQVNYDLIIENWMDDKFNEILSKFQTTLSSSTLSNTTLKWVNHPGLSFSLGCDSWEENGFKGSVNGYSCSPMISWLSLGKINLVDSSKFSISTNNRQKVSKRHELLSLISPLFDIPHFKLVVSHVEDGIKKEEEEKTKEQYSSIQMDIDFIPRRDLPSNMEYYDRYYLGLDKYIYNLLESTKESGVISFVNEPYKVLHRLVSSPASLHIKIKNTMEGRKLVDSIINDYIEKYLNWLQSASIMMNTSFIEDYASRDKKLYRVIFDHIKFNLAEVIGPDFSPKAAEATVSMMGPETTNYLIHQS